MGRNLEEFIRQNFQKAIDYREIQAFYQPVVRTSSRQLCSFEALARWIDPEIGMIYPDEFIPVLEREGLIHLLDVAILRQVCARIRSTIAGGGTPIPVSVNLSRLDFALCDIFTVADNIVSDYRIPHDFIYFEITESVMAEQKELMLGIVERFRSAGYQIWMDDFGSAYSSLNVLKEFTFDELKLDMSFLRPFNLRSKRIVTAVVKMAKVIDIHTLAEGVETEEQFDYLRDIGCEKVQGYFFGKPMPYEDAIANLRDKGVEIEPPQDRRFYDDIGKLSRNMINLMDSVKVNGDGRMLFTINEQYYEIKARRMSRTEDKYCVLIGVTNLTKDAQADKTGYLDDSVREVDGKPITLYLSVGYALYSEYLDQEEQTKSAEMRLHADYDRNISAESRIGHASELFSLFDHLPVPYAVFHVTYAEHSGKYDAVFFYVNHKYEEFADLPAKAMLGHTVREVFPFLEDEWYLDVKSAALDGKAVEGEFDVPQTGKHYRFTTRQIVYPGYCAITCVEMPTAEPSRKSVLIADSNEDDCETLGGLLRADYGVLYASDGAEALEMLQSHRDEIALALLDLDLPKMTGREVLARMHADEKQSSVPVIVCAADRTAELECLKLGAMDFIPKPYPDFEIVKARIAKCIELSEKR